MKIVKPLTLGLLHQPYRWRGRDRLSIAALGFFALGAENARFLTENLQWPKVLPQLPRGQPLDLVMPKANAEVAMYAVAHAPAPVAEMQARLQCGRIDKTLRVVGDRAWKRTWWGGVCEYAPKPFAKMPLTLERAYGGAGHRNPAGVGFLPRGHFFRVAGGLLPNVERPGRPVRPGRRQAPHAAFAAQRLEHAVAARRASGTYDARWFARDFPGLPQDFDFAIYNLTPPDQQFRGAFEGGEAYRLEGVHPDGALAGRLPAVRVGAWVLGEGQAPEQAREIALACDTVCFFPEVGLGLMIHRGQVEVSDSDALDVAALMLGYDDASAPRDGAHFREVLRMRLDRTQAALHAFDESQLAPVPGAQALAAREAARARDLQALQQRRQRMLDGAMAEFRERGGMAPEPGTPPPVAPEPALPTIPPSALADGDFDLSELYRKAQAAAEDARRQAEARRAELDAKLPPKPQIPEASIDDRIREAIARASTPAWDLIGVPPPPGALAAAAASAQRAGIAGDEARRLAEAQAAIAALEARKRQARTAAPKPTTLETPLPPPVAKALGELLREALRAGQPLMGRDFAGADLRGVDLRGLDLREIMLERADLGGACLAGADLRSAALTAARLDAADLRGARLEGANLCGASAVRANFSGARLDRVHAQDADLSSADLGDAHCDGALLMKARMRDARWNGATLVRVVMSGAEAAGSQWIGSRWTMCVAARADFGGARFDGATMTRTALMDARCVDSGWEGATLSGVFGGGASDWSGCRLDLARASKSGWHGARMVGARLDGGTFASCDFGMADLSGASLRGARLYRSLFMRTRLRGADASAASFFQALCRKADFREATLAGAVLVQANLAEADLADARMVGARVDRPVGVP